MSDSVRVDSDGVAAPVGGLRDLGDRLNAIGHSLQRRLDALGPCWGDDSTGRGFEQQYIQPRNQMLVGVPSLGEVLGTVADRLETMSRDYAHTEEQAVKLARRIAGEPATQSGSGRYYGVPSEPAAPRLAERRRVMPAEGVERERATEPGSGTYDGSVRARDLVLEEPSPPTTP